MKTFFAFVATVLLSAGFAGRLPAQLAITEVMAESSINGLPAFRGPDYWELTNFGTNDINLHGYGFHDDKPVIQTGVFNNLTIRGGESIIFCRSNGPTATITNLEGFKKWWGENKLPTDLQVRFYDPPGLSGDGDQLWVKDPAGNVVDMVTFGASQRGRSMIYDLEDTGTFGYPSVPDVNGAFRAASLTNDVGSPGSTSGRVSLRILRQPTSQTVDGCSGVQFSVLAGGVPRPGYQWTSNGVPLPGATGAKLTLPDIGSWSAGEYRVRLSNGFDELLSDPAILFVNTNPLAPWFTLPPIDVTVFPGQTGRFSAEIRGFPCADFHWHSNNVPLPGENGRTLAVALPQDALPATNLYSLTISNAVGSATASARLVVMRLPCLQITEVMAWPTNDAVLGHNGWFELTSCDTNEVNLQGYRFRDTDLLEVAFIITNTVIIHPGESVIFAESISREAFVQWWGADQLPPGLQVVTWRGWGLSKTSSDTINLWNSSPNDSGNTLATLSLLDSIPGFSQETYNFCDETHGCGAGYFGESVLWENGAFPAAIGGDIGSPGYTTNPPPRLLTVSLNITGVQVRCRVVAGKHYRLSFKNALKDLAWTPLTPELADGSILTLHDSPPGGTKARFYRVEELP